MWAVPDIRVLLTSSVYYSIRVLLTSMYYCQPALNEEVSPDAQPTAWKCLLPVSGTDTCQRKVSGFLGPKCRLGTSPMSPTRVKDSEAV